MANIEVKDLLQEDEFLSELVSQAHVEIGQRFKVLNKIGSQWKLTDPELRPWFETCDTKGSMYSLYGSVGSFSQVGRAINQKLVNGALQKAEGFPYRQVIELGAGSGNFTLGFASIGFNVVAMEQSAEALGGLKRALQDYPALSSRIECRVGNFQTLNWGEWAQRESLLFLDPPRSGVGENLLRQIPLGHFPAIIYVACGVETWFRDGKMLKDMGYQLSSLEWVDQFPNTSLYEVISSWKKELNFS
jgi:tRNA/tmRNA/rRNA uracil-C5-methylase (TrmA/RlmC/RlmD family)